MPESIVYSLRLPPDPPRSFDINRVTPKVLFEATNTADMASALIPICKLVGLPDYKEMTSYVASPNDWFHHPLSRSYWVVYWLMLENNARKA